MNLMKWIGSAANGQEAEAAQKTQKTQGFGAITGAATSNLKRLMSNPKAVKELKVGALIAVISALGIFIYERIRNKPK